MYIILFSTYDFSEADVMYNEKRDNIGHKYNIIHSVGNQVIREWLQSLNNPFYWPNSWLSKGFNIFFATHFLNQVVLLVTFIQLIHEIVIKTVSKYIFTDAYI